MARANDGRSPTDEFRQGCIDRTYIQIAPDVGGIVEMDWRVDRAVNTMPFQYLNAEIKPQDPMDFARRHHAGRDIEPYSAYLPRRDIVDRPLTDKGLRPVL